MPELSRKNEILTLLGVLMGIAGGILGNFLVSSYYMRDYLTLGVCLVATGAVLIFIYLKINALSGE